MSSQALIDKILVQADAEAEQITDEILRRAGENEKLTLERAAAECKTTESDSERECAQILRIAELNSGLQSRKALLHARRELLDEAFGRAYRKVLSLKGAERVSFLCDLIKKHAPAKTFTACVSPDEAKAAKERYPEAELLVHPECVPAVCAQADYVGSTSGIMNYAVNSDKKEFIIGTEISIAEHLQYMCPDKTFHILSLKLICPNMKATTLVDVYNCLAENGGEEIELDDETIRDAKRCIDEMIRLGD